MKKRTLALLVLAALLAVWRTWYARPITIQNLGPDMKPEIISVTLIRNGGGADIETRSLHLEAGNPDFQPFLERLEELRFHHWPTNPLLQAMPFLESLGE